MINDKLKWQAFSFGLDMIDTHGKDEQIIKAAEELNELQRELFRARTNRIDMDHIAEEMADVLIMLYQLKAIFDISSGQIEEWVRYKIDRETKKLYGD